MEGHVSDCGHRIMSLIGPWVDQKTRQKLEEELLGILFQAVRLSQTLRCQRASWSVRHVVDPSTQDPGLTTSASPPLFFDEAVMDDKHGDDDSDIDADDPMDRSRKIVEVVVSPALFKRGNTDGERFEIESCVEPAEVKCYSQLS